MTFKGGLGCFKNRAVKFDKDDNSRMPCQISVKFTSVFPLISKGKCNICRCTNKFANLMEELVKKNRKSILIVLCVSCYFQHLY